MQRQECNGSFGTWTAGRERVAGAIKNTKTWLLNIVGIALICVCVLNFCANIWRVLQSSDTAWLIKTGEYIAQHGLQVTDVFSWTVKDRPWIIYQWMFALAFGALFHKGGLWLVGLTAALAAADV